MACGRARSGRVRVWFSGAGCCCEVGEQGGWWELGFVLGLSARNATMRRYVPVVGTVLGAAVLVVVWLLWLCVDIAPV